MFKEIKFDGTPDEINQQWLERRKHGIGGSDAAAILGLNKYATPYTVWLEKTNRTEPEDLSENEKVYWGNVLEPVIAEEFVLRHFEFKIEEPGAMYQSEEYPWMLASVDRVIFEQTEKIKAEKVTITRWEPKGILEIKTCGERMRPEWEDGVPDYYLAQVNHYLAVTGYDYAYVAVLIAGQEYREYKIERDEEDIQWLNCKEMEFWNEYVEADQVPPLRGNSADSDALLGQFPVADDMFVKALDDDLPQLEEYVKLGTTIKELEEKRKELGNEIKLMIGDHWGIETPKYTIKWSRSDYETFDSKRFKKENPDLFLKYMKSSKRDSGIRISKNF